MFVVRSPRFRWYGDYAEVRLLQNQWFPICFASMFALTGLLSATAFITMLRWVCCKINGFLFVSHAFWLSLGVLSATAFITMLRYVVSKSVFFHLFYNHFWLSLGVLSATPFITMLRCVRFNINACQLV